MSNLYNRSKIKFSHPYQILNMGGPWIGNLYVNEEIICRNVIIDNIIISSDRKKLYFIKYNKVSKWANENYFTLRYIEAPTKKKIEYDLTFETIYVKEIDENNNLTFYSCFQDNKEEKQKRLNLNEIGSHIWRKM